jgi:HK97 family phage portal protein
MGLVFGRREGGTSKRLWGIGSVGEMIPPRQMASPNMPYVSDDTAMRHSAVWAALRLRADLISTMPIDVYRNVSLGSGVSMQVEAAKTPILVNPGGDRVGWNEWCYSSQIELDRSGNSIGIIRETDASGYPARIDLKPSSIVSIHVKGGDLDHYRIGGTRYEPEEIWHEKQYTISGMHVGLSPVAYAAFVVGEYFSIQHFATSWFTSGAVPRARLKNTEKKLSPVEATKVKEAWRGSQAMGEPFVHGSDWEYSLIQAEHASSDWLEGEKASAIDVSRFFGVPADLIDAALATGKGSITYANISQRNLQLLITNLGPAITRRENSISGGLLPKPRYIKFNTNSLLRMDPASSAAMLKLQIDSRVLAPSEARALDNRAPFTQAQKDEFDEFWPAKSATAPTAEPGQSNDTTAPPQEGQSDNGN